MTILFVASLIFFLVVEVSLTTSIFSSTSFVFVKKSTQAVWCLVPLILVACLLINHSESFLHLTQPSLMVQWVRR